MHFKFICAKLKPSLAVGLFSNYWPIEFVMGLTRVDVNSRDCC